MYTGLVNDMKVYNRALQKLTISTPWNLGSNTEVRKNASGWQIPHALS